jgi:hypothetical protein
MEKMKRKKKITIIVCVILAVLILLLVVAPFGISVGVYNSAFGERYTSYEPLAYKVSDFEGLKAERLQFTSDKGQKLIGYLYYVTDDMPKGVIIIAHGLGGGGHNSYMDSANYFAQNGYNVFAYDATGNDESEGEGTLGLPQGVIDLSYAIDFVEGLDKFKDLPIMLFGHSWGGYAVCNVLNYHSEVKAVVSLSGFNKSSDLINVQGEEMFGGAVNLLMPYVNAYEAIKFGKFANTTALDGFANSNAGVYIVHSKDDTSVPAQYGYDIYYKKYSNDSRFKFKLYENKGHSYVYCSQAALNYIDKFNAAYVEYFKTHELTADTRAEYINQNLDRTIWNNLLDSELYQSILEFYDSYL